MKKIILFFIVLTVTSCSKNITDLNKETKNASVVKGETLFSNAEKNLVDQMTSTSVYNNVFRLFAQYWAQTTYTQESNYELGTASVPSGVWKALYKVLKDLKESERLIRLDDNPVNAAANKNKLAIIETLNVYTFKTLVDTFGNIPYSQSLSIDNPVYDDAEMIYKDLAKRISAAAAAMNISNEGFGTADLIYKQNDAMKKWQQLANAIKLEIGVVLGDGAMISSAANNTLKSNEDNATLNYLGAAPNTNPLWTDLVNSGREDYVVANTATTLLSDLQDPRRNKYFADNLSTYNGGVYGANNTFALFTHINDRFKVPTLPGILYSYSQVEFFLAEAAERALYGSPSDAKTHYEAGVKASVLYWGASNADAEVYLNGPASYTSAKSWQEKIGVQTWIANYNRGMEGWTSWRRLDFPKLNIPALSKLPVPLRFTYPVTEQTLNGENYRQAASAIGGDRQQSRIFWDKK